ncbi:MAG TPA: hypothetical protein VET87_10685 [Rubrivivax sp.]|jgi:hypothetical protein|nr:hypothetical protein [Rubrivivax sp.]
MSSGRPQTLRLAACALCLVISAAAGAGPPQTVYRCGPDGRVYSQTPCADGRPVTVEDPRSAHQQKSAREVAARDAEQAQQLAAERKQREAAAKAQPAAGIKTAPAQGGASAPSRKTKSTAKAAAADAPQMSPAMRVPAPAPTSK